MGKPGLVYRAALEGVTYSLLSGVNQMKALTGVSDLKQLIVVGGGSHNQLWCQIIADSFGVPVSLPNEVETAALGGKHEHHIDRYHSPPSKEYHHLSTAHNMTTNSKHKLRQNKKKNTNRQPLLVYYCILSLAKGALQAAAVYHGENVASFASVHCPEMKRTIEPNFEDAALYQAALERHEAFGKKLFA